jgi:hypothetical protein
MSYMQEQSATGSAEPILPEAETEREA